MNIFVLDFDPSVAAQMHCDKHANKMILEGAQMLSTAVREHCANIDDRVYKSAYINHPCTVWARKNRSNFKWLSELVYHLGLEKKYRWPDKPHHKSWVLLVEVISSYIDCIPDGQLTDFVLAMPDKYKCNDPVKAYRDYYKNEKKHLLVYTKRDMPVFLK